MLVLRHGERCVEGHLQLVVMVAVEARREHFRHLDPGHDLRSHRNQLFDGKTHTHRLTCLRRQRIEVDAQLPQCGSRNLRMVVLHPFELHRIHTMIVQRLQPLLVVGVLRQAKQVVDHILHGVEGYFQKLEVDGFVRLRLEAAPHRSARPRKTTARSLSVAPRYAPRNGCRVRASPKRPAPRPFRDGAPEASLCSRATEAPPALDSFPFP